MKRILKNLKFLKIEDFFAVFILLAALPFSLFFKLYNKIKKRKLWLICENGLTARDNGYYFYKYVKQKYPEEYCFFVIDKNSPEYKKVKDYKDIIQFKSFKHWIYYLAADLNISSQKKGNPSQALFYVLHVCLGLIKNRVFLQHGIIKDYLDFQTYDNTKYKYFICGAKQEYEYIKEKYNYPEASVAYTGLARFDNLHNFKTDKKQILCMPTWRNWIGRDTNFLGKKINLKETDYYKYWNGLLNNKKLIEFIEERNITILFYLHIEMQKYCKEFNSVSKNIKFLNLDYDIQEVLKKSSLLITDYSSVFFDFAYMKKPIIYFQFDEEAYRNTGYQEGYFSYQKNGFGDITRNIEDTVNKIIQNIENRYEVKDIYLERMNNFFEFCDDKNCQRIYELLKNDEKGTFEGKK